MSDRVPDMRQNMCQIECLNIFQMQRHIICPCQITRQMKAHISGGLHVLWAPKNHQF